VFTLGFLMMLPFCWGQTADIQWRELNWLQLASLLYIGIAGTFLAYYFNIYGIGKLGASVTGSYIYTQPVFAVVIAIFALGESVTWQKALAAVLIFAGVFLVNRKVKSQN
jgi:drug/metabolite transporter (DMT)-like permease